MNRDFPALLGRLPSDPAAADHCMPALDRHGFVQKVTPPKSTAPVRARINGSLMQTDGQSRGVRSPWIRLMGPIAGKPGKQCG
jgi:propanediol utilization protein